MKLTQDGGEDGGRGRKGKETRGNRRGKDLNRIMARNDDGRFYERTQRAIRSTSVSIILNVVMEGERERERNIAVAMRNSIQREEINKSIPFLELVHSLEFSLLANVGHRRKSNRVSLPSEGNVTSEKRRQISSFLSIRSLIF